MPIPGTDKIANLKLMRAGSGYLIDGGRVGAIDRIFPLGAGAVGA